MGTAYGLASVSFVGGLLLSLGSLVRIIVGVVLWKRVSRFPWGLAVDGAVFLGSLAALGFGVFALGPARLLRVIL